MEKICAVYKIINTVTNDFYIGSSNNVFHRWADHKCISTWKKCPNNPLYCDFQKYGIDKFQFQILCLVESKHLKQTEQEFIERLHPTYNDRRSNGLNVERQKEYKKEYEKEYQQSNKGREVHKKAQKKYANQLCSYNGETLKLHALALRFFRAGIEQPTLEAKKYLLEK